MQSVEKLLRLSATANATVVFTLRSFRKEKNSKKVLTRESGSGIITKLSRERNVLVKRLKKLKKV